MIRKRAAIVGGYLVLLAGGYFAVGEVVEAEERRAVEIEKRSCSDLSAAITELNARVEPHEVLRLASLHAIRTAQGTADTQKEATQFRRSADALRGAKFTTVALPDCGAIG